MLKKLSAALCPRKIFWMSVAAALILAAALAVASGSGGGERGGVPPRSMRLEVGERMVLVLVLES